ncbi:hypothetical protein COHA_010603 [Chlorella ohadii]|uniref:Phytocyanin domain-containing protein n=1 Tax=Chlorella ohadii TaxID=2649997 RepID=A0AAD5DDG7_9CHLO|nr:hypothetical protein COHA_010603 [Chlorella ohadii]
MSGWLASTLLSNLPCLQLIQVGDAVEFTWSGNHDVWRVPEAACPSAFEAGAGLEEVAPPSVGGSTTVMFDTPGTYHFACSVGGGGHCNNGMLITFEVEP